LGTKILKTPHRRSGRTASDLFDGRSGQQRHPRPPVEHFTEQLLTVGVRSGEFRPLDVRMVMSSVIGILAYVQVWFRASTGKVQATLVQELTDFVMNGIVAAPPDAPAAARAARAARGKLQRPTAQ
jgi:Tetracyclin repressor-like, C-terminal domain